MSRLVPSARYKEHHINCIMPIVIDFLLRALKFKLRHAGVSSIEHNKSANLL